MPSGEDAAVDSSNASARNDPRAILVRDCQRFGQSIYRHTGRVWGRSIVRPSQPRAVIVAVPVDGAILHSVVNPALEAIFDRILAAFEEDCWEGFAFTVVGLFTETRDMNLILVSVHINSLARGRESGISCTKNQSSCQENDDNDHDRHDDSGRDNRTTFP